VEGHGREAAYQADEEGEAEDLLSFRGNVESEQLLRRGERSAPRLLYAECERFHFVLKLFGAAGVRKPAT